MLQSDNALECVEITLAADISKRSTEFLAAICYHHYHGKVEDKAFEILEHRGITFEADERDFVNTLLMTLLKKQRSVCTIKGAVNALAGMKNDQLFEILANLLPQDLNVFFPMNIPNALAKLGDPRAIPLLISVIEEPVQSKNNDNDSSDDFLTLGIGRSSALVVKCCLALSPFIDDQKVKNCLINALNQEETHEACLAVLAVCMNEQKYLDELEKILADGNTFDYRIADYLQKNVGQRPEIEKLLMFNEDIQTKRVNNKNVNDN
ncbi:hypothetical protein I4U23_019876 [Adineta vaga]|nr:hypothetical protein I4U23_019876 [Adineta vaga]